jgi:hypothetical protein
MDKRLSLAVNISWRIEHVQGPGGRILGRHHSRVNEDTGPRISAAKVAPISAYHRIRRRAGRTARGRAAHGSGPITTTTFALNETQHVRADALVEPALRFLETSGYPLGVSLVRHLWRDSPAQEVLDALSAYQNPDGGFGRGLEVDIKAPVSNPFATRLAMQVLLGLPPGAGREMRRAIARWLVANHHADGDWQFAPEVLEHDVAPWFAAWTFPSLNPACCLAGLANRLGVATPEMLSRVEGIFRRLGSIDEARNGAFYNVLPYVEYVAGIPFPERDAYVAAIAEGIAAREYEDAGHFFDHALGGGRDVVAQIAGARLATEVDRLMSDVGSDGGWPTPYDPAWRPWATASALMTLARLRDGA